MSTGALARSLVRGKGARQDGCRCRWMSGRRSARTVPATEDRQPGALLARARARRARFTRAECRSCAPRAFARGCRRSAPTRCVIRRRPRCCGAARRLRRSRRCCATASSDDRGLREGRPRCAAAARAAMAGVRHETPALRPRRLFADPPPARVPARTRAAAQHLVDFLERAGAPQITTGLALAWARQPARTPLPVASGWVVRGFARHLATIDPRARFPPGSAAGAPPARGALHLLAGARSRL